MSQQPLSPHALSKHRIEALTDGIYAVAMTLLVIELKLPTPETITSHGGLISAMGHLIPKFIAWLISFFVLALFWLGNHRLFQYVRHVDGKLVALCILQLGAVSLMPFASSLSGEYVMLLIAQIFYSGMMALLGVCAMFVTRYIYRHPELCHPAMPQGTYRAAMFRLWMLVAISLAAIIVGRYLPSAGNALFMLMIIIGPISRRIEKKYNQRSTTEILSV
jgi:uncharacterized membrane protein